MFAQHSTAVTLQKCSHAARMDLEYLQEMTNIIGVHFVLYVEHTKQQFILCLCVLLVLSDAGLCGQRLFRLNARLLSCLSCLGRTLRDVLTLDTQVCCGNMFRRGSEGLQRIR